ncbi:MAG TPA: substrate-binding domain-containing protein [Burkholderiales bacterium]|nr:substrate-binding domain-containing protein [Burkholderiales bacterium]
MSTTSVFIRIVTSNATNALLSALAARFEARTGLRVAIEHDSAKTLLARIEAGERADVAVLNAPHVERLVGLGILEAARPFARSLIGVAVRKGEPHPDVSTVDALRAALLGARAIAHTVHGASGMYVPELLRRLGIADAMKARIVTRPGGLIAKVVEAGEADIAIQQISELLAVPGVEVVAPLPDAVQKTLESAAAIFTGTPRRAAAEGWLRFFQSPEAAGLFQEKGLEAAGCSNGAVR